MRPAVVTGAAFLAGLSPAPAKSADAARGAC